MSELLFTTFEVITVERAVAIVSLVTADGESNWMEGVLLLVVYDPCDRVLLFAGESPSNLTQALDEIPR
jgi:Ca2+/H+ antiporter